MPILVDGHNLIGRLSRPSLQDPDDEAELIRMLGSYRARTGRAITVVFDPGSTFALSQTSRVRGIDVVFAPHGSDADGVIVRLVRKNPDPRSWQVVTSDRSLASRVQELGARVQPAEVFAQQLELRGSEEEGLPWKEQALSQEEMEEWLGLFEGRDGHT